MARKRRLTKLELLDREIVTGLARLSVETGLASTMAEGRKQAREVYNPAPELARRRLRALDGGRA
jgi:hypothetical protein